jgi:hypothetical protein
MLRTRISYSALLTASLLLFAHSSIEARDIADLRRADVIEAVDRAEHGHTSQRDCWWIDYACNLTYYVQIPNEYGEDFFNMRFTPTGCCTLVTVDFSLYDNYPEFSNVSGSGIDIHVWDDIGGLPGALVAGPINVPAADLVFDPGIVTVDLSAYGLIFCDDFHVGYTVVDQAVDNIAILLDDGSCGSMHASAYHSGIWDPILDLWGIDANFLIAAEICCETVQTSRITYTPDVGEFGLALGCGARGNSHTLVYHTCPYSGASTVDHYDLDNGTGGTIVGSEYSNLPAASDDWVTWPAGHFNDYKEVFIARCGDFGASYQVSLEEGIYDMACPIVSGRTLAWVGRVLSSPEEDVLWELFWADTSFAWLGIYEHNPFPFNYIQHDVYDSIIVWSGIPAYDPDTLAEIFVSMVPPGIEWQLTDNDRDDTEVRIHGDWIVWAQFDGIDYEIVMHLASEPPGLDSIVTENDYDDRNPDIDGGFVVWNGFDGEDWEIFLLKGGVTFQLTDNSEDDLFPEVKFPLIVWSGFDGNDWEIYLYDITSETVNQVTINDNPDTEPRTNGIDVVWIGYLDGEPCGQHEIFRLGGGPCDCTPGDANGTEGIDIDDVVYLIAYIFSGGSPPTPYAVCSGDPNCSCGVDIDDVVFLIAYIFSGGEAPCICEEWASGCGEPRR